MNNYAIIDINGKQAKVYPGYKLDIDRCAGQPGDEISCNKILFYTNNDSSLLGEKCKGIKVVLKILEHFRDDKVIVFKKKKRKTYQRKMGFRAQKTKLLVENFIEG
jgi:large subunit ribosomal protein L21